MSDIYLVEDHAMVRDGLTAVLERAGHRIIGESDCPTRALADVLRLTPQILLLDLHLGRRSGFELLERLQQRRLATRTIVLTMSEQPRDMAEAMRLGAQGYVLKGSSASQVVATVQAVASGRHPIAALASSLAPRRADNEALAGLSVRERQVVLLVVRGHSSAAIGEQLSLSPKTVDSYRSRVMDKLGVGHVTALVRLAIRERLISAEEV